VRCSYRLPPISENTDNQANCAAGISSRDGSTERPASTELS